MTEVFGRYFKRCAPAPAFISAAFISIYADVLEIRQLARRKKSCDARGSTHASNRRGGCLLSTHLATTLIKCADVMINCSDDSSYFTILSVEIIYSRCSKKRGERKRYGS